MASHSARSDRARDRNITQLFSQQKYHLILNPNTEINKHTYKEQVSIEYVRTTVTELCIAEFCQTYTMSQNTPRCLSYLQQNQANSDKIWYISP